jgi:N-acetylneuraminate lyase
MGRFQGPWPALVTPFTRAGDVNAPVLRDVVEYLLGKSIGGLYVCGSTGEGIYMSVEERRLVAETVLAQVQGRAPVIVHVGCVSVRDAVTLAQHARAAGADGIASIIPPLYRDAQSIYDYFAAISAATPTLPLLSYIFGGPVDAVALMRKLMEISTVAGCKYTGPDMHEFRQIVALSASYSGPHEWTVFSGMDEECLFAAMFGASGNIGSTLNYIPGVYREIHACQQSGDFARGLELQLAANETTRIMFSFGYMGALKEAMRILGFDCGQPRLPNRPFPAEQSAAMRAQLKRADFFALAEL